MGIESIIAKLCVQTAVYWGSPVNNGHGGFTFADPIEIACRWEDTGQILMDNKGAEFTSRALVYVTEDVEENGMLYFGTLDDLDSSQEANPISIEKAYYIKRFEKIPALEKSNEFLRKAYLTPSLSFGGF